MSNVNLLVDCLKVIGWLQDRKKLRKDWYSYLKAAEQQLKVLLRDSQWTVSYPSIHQLLQTQHHNFNFNDLCQMIDLLLKTDIAQQKNILFGYSDKRVAEWTRLKKYMEGNNIQLLNLAKFIEQSLRFDLPGLNKTIESVDNQLTTLRRKVDFNNNTIFQERKKLQSERALLGGQSGKEQEMPIQQLIEWLVSRGGQQIKKLEEMVCCQDSQRLLEFFNQANSQNQTQNSLETLEYFIKNGDEFMEVHNSPDKKKEFYSIVKYREFSSWRGSKHWGIQIQGQKQEQVNINSSTVIQNRQFRQKLLTDLNQLLFFFKGTKYELQTAEKGLGFQPQNLKSKSMASGDIDSAIRHLQSILSYITSKRLVAPLELKNSSKAYQVLVGQFKGYEANIRTMEVQIINYQGQIVELEQQRMKQGEKLMQLRKKVAHCKPICQSLLSGLVKREVKITGEINKLND